MSHLESIGWCKPENSIYYAPRKNIGAAYIFLYSSIINSVKSPSSTYWT